MKDAKPYIGVLITVGLLCSIFLLLQGCASIKLRSTPPTIQDVSQQFENNRDDILTVVDFLLKSEYESILIWDSDGTMQVDLDSSTPELNWIPIKDATIIAAVKRLLDNGKYKSISKKGDTINIPQWYSPQQQGCGIAYSRDQSTFPTVAYVTKFTPLGEIGWYYYSYDYNEWRIEETRKKN